MPILDDVRARLEAGAVGWKIYSASFPPGGPTSQPAVPDDAIALFEYAGGPPLHTKGVATPAARTPRCQIVCRSKSYATARSKAEEVVLLLSGRGGIRALGEPFPLDRDEGQRARIACNFESLTV